MLRPDEALNAATRYTDRNTPLVESGQLRDVFSKALTIETEAKRRQYVIDACGDDARRRQQVEELLQSHYEAGSFLSEFDPENTISIAESPQAVGIPEGVGTTIGVYELLEQIGEG